MMHILGVTKHYGNEGDLLQVSRGTAHDFGVKSEQDLPGLTTPLPFVLIFEASELPGLGGNEAGCWKRALSRGELWEISDTEVEFGVAVTR